jgi:formate hydrogenlyase transcriptional activator
MQCAAWRTDDDRRAHAIGSGQPFDRDVARVLTGGKVDRIARQHQHDCGGDEHAVADSGVAGVRTEGAIVYKSEAIRSVLTQVHQVAPTNATVLLLGETGVGKQLFAQAIHDASSRRGLPMISVNCAAIPTTLIESELFGHERGAFTGAVARQIGRFEVANGSTLFLDEIGEVPLEVQIKLLRVLQERVIERLGGHGSKAIDVRIIAATNRDLEQAVRDYTFREDLYYRLNVFPITVPPLRERVEDIPGLAWTFIHELSRTLGKRVAGISSRSLVELQQYPWPGNVRELRNVIEREMIQATGPTLTPAIPRVSRLRPGIVSQRLVDVQVEHIRAVLDSCNWRIRGEGGAAERLGLKPTTLETRMARLGIFRSQHVANTPIRTGA